MTPRIRRLAWMFVLSICATALAEDQAGSVSLRAHSEHGKHPVFELTGLDDATLATCEQDPARAASLLAVYTVENPKDNHIGRPTVLGTYEVDPKSRVLRFTLRFPAEPGVRYRAIYRPGQKTNVHASAELFMMPRPTAAQPTRIVRVFPSQAVLPENLLKFYIEFSAPMSRGHAYEHLSLLDESGKPLDLPFLELGEELWDPRGIRFTLLFDPGRIKRGVKPREDLGPVLQQGKSYTLVIDQGWSDAEGTALLAEFRKPFKVGPPDGSPPDPKTWTLQTPTAGTRGPLVVRFPEPLDAAMLARVLAVARVPGAGTVGPGELSWSFQPDAPWRSGTYELLIDQALEDRAGNSIGRPFDVDVFEKIESSRGAEPVRLSFQVAGRK